MTKQGLCAAEKDREDVLKKLLSLVLTLGTLALCGCQSASETSSVNPNSDNSSSASDSKVEPKSNTVSFCAVGDNLIHQTIYEEADSFSGSIDDGKYDFTPFYSEVKDDIASYDLSFINQETIVGGYDMGLSGYPVFNSPDEVADAVKKVGFDLVNMATNHSLDMGQDGIDHAVDVFDGLNLCHDGVYKDSESKQSINIVEKNGIKFALVSFTESTNGITAPYDYSISTFDDDDYIKEKIESAKLIADFVIVSAHWGTENSFDTDDFQKYYSQYLADCGADLIIGTHPHTIEPVEWVTSSDGRKVLCAYSLGNFLGGMLSPDNCLSAMLSLDITKNDDGSFTTQNVKWTPLVIHFEGDQSDIMNVRYGYKIYKLKDYTDSLAVKHVLNGYDGEEVSVSFFENKTREVISSEFYS